MEATQPSPTNETTSEVKIEIGLSKRQQKLKLLSALKDKQKSDLNQNTTAFRKVEKYFKGKVVQPEYTNCLDFTNLKGEEEGTRYSEVKLSFDLNQLDTRFQSGSDKCYKLPQVPGLIIIPSLFSYPVQKELLNQTLNTCLQPPYLNNLNTHYQLPKENLLDLYKQNYDLPLPQQLKVSKKSIAVDKLTSLATEGYVYDGLNDKNQPIKKTNLVDELSLAQVVRKLRWVTFGSQYHWPTKTYLPNLDVPVPQPFVELCQKIILGLNNSKIPINEGKEYRAEAGVVNFYQPEDSLMGHVDQSEPNLKAPLVSFSFGLKCVFLIGGPTKHTEPIPIILNPGDVLIMSDESRLAYHGVPRVLENSLPEAYLQDIQDPTRKSMLDYLKTTRINLNFRQVTP